MKDDFYITNIEVKGIRWTGGLLFPKMFQTMIFKFEGFNDKIERLKCTRTRLHLQNKIYFYFIFYTIIHIKTHINFQQIWIIKNFTFHR